MKNSKKSQAEIIEMMKNTENRLMLYMAVYCLLRARKNSDKYLETTVESYKAVEFLESLGLVEATGAQYTNTGEGNLLADKINEKGLVRFAKDEGDLIERVIDEHLELEQADITSPYVDELVLML